MPTAAVGTFQFRYIEGQNGQDVPLAELKFIPFTRPGYAGIGLQEDAVRGEIITIVGMAPYASPILRSLAMIQAAALPASGLCEMYDNDGENWHHMKVSNVRCVKKNVKSDTEGLDYYLYVMMDLQSMATGY